MCLPGSVCDVPHIGPKFQKKIFLKNQIFIILKTYLNIGTKNRKMFKNIELHSWTFFWIFGPVCSVLTRTALCKAKLQGSRHHMRHRNLASWVLRGLQSWRCSRASWGARYPLAIVWRIRNQWCAALKGRRRHRHTKCWLASNPDERSGNKNDNFKDFFVC